MRYQDDKEILETFVIECRDHLQELESGILELEGNSFDENRIHSMFRAAHSIKASANLMEFHNIELIAHALEEILQVVRVKQHTLDSDQVSLFLRGLDRLGELVIHLEKSDLVDVGLLVASLNTLTGNLS